MRHIILIATHYLLRQEDVIFHWWVFMGQLCSEPER